MTRIGIAGVARVGVGILSGAWGEVSGEVSGMLCVRLSFSDVYCDVLIPSSSS